MRSRASLAVLALCLCFAEAASSSDLTGTWQYVRLYTCTYLAPDGGVRKSRENAYPGLSISQAADGALIMNSGQPWVGHIFWDTRGTGHGMAHRCYSSSSTTTMEIESAKTFPVNARGVSGRMLVSYRAVGTYSDFQCKRIEFERVNTANPNPAPCP